MSNHSILFFGELMNERISKIHEKFDQINSELNSKGYISEEIIGQGGFSAVFLVSSDKYKSRKFVAKVSNKYDRRGNVIHREVDLLIDLIHPNIITMYEYFYDNDFLYMILEHCPGGSLEDAIKNEGPLCQKELYRVFTSIVQAVVCCHQKGIAHQDIKPSNILLDEHGRVKLADFGVSQKYDRNDYKFKVKTLVGTKWCMSPEKMNRVEHNPFSSDIWSLGITFLELASGKNPWNNYSLDSIENMIKFGMVPFQDHNLPEEFERILRKMCNADPSKRAKIDWILKQDLVQEKINLMPLALTYSHNPKLGHAVGMSLQTQTSRPLLLQRIASGRVGEKISNGNESSNINVSQNMSNNQFKSFMLFSLSARKDRIKNAPSKMGQPSGIRRTSFAATLFSEPI
ncbi:CAMK family protein kinase [Tritrichomonas foetus]|uniref:CAMK family protein kinase n=1 Tax=Tritrichomonas foetus TaxID=1144522 RepID=A0A1J4JSV0_9EUKA|nr:CAMK family protein kinase [Tritrichomonas foetus]|eukprot:OHT00580.1 CAMK family protein kinase [Tritrichomonas foetus]